MGSYLVVYPVAVLILMVKVNQSWKVLAGPAEMLAAKRASQTKVRLVQIKYL
jgi:cytochrome c-type biogenesis protein CcmE